MFNKKIRKKKVFHENKQTNKRTFVRTKTTTKYHPSFFANNNNK